MELHYSYPTYRIDLTPQMLEQCADIAARLLKEVGMLVRHKEFLDKIRNKPGIRIAGERVYFDEDLTRKAIEKFIAREKKGLEQEKEME